VGYAVLIYQAAVKCKSTSVLDINYCTCTLKYSCPGNSSVVPAFSWCTEAVSYKSSYTILISHTHIYKKGKRKSSTESENSFSTYCPTSVFLESRTELLRQFVNISLSWHDTIWQFCLRRFGSVIQKTAL